MIVVGPDILAMRWADQSACRLAVEAGYALRSWWFPGRDQREGLAAKQLCAACPVRATCLDWAVKHREAGIWGGLNDRERARLPVQVRICVECGAEFVHRVTGGGRHPATCSKPCRRARRQRQQWASYERSGRASTPGLYAERGHGTLPRYAAGCKCQSCRKVARVARAGARRRRKGL